MADETPNDTIEDQEEVYVPTSWEFPDAPPRTTDVMDKLRALNDRWGLSLDDYVAYVQPLGQSKNVSTDKKRKEYKTIYTLYVTVAGRVAMANDAAEKRGWRIDFVPEPNTPTGVPGYLVYDSKYLVYREYVEIWAPVGPAKILKTEDEALTYSDWVLIGRKPGTASVPATGGSGAVESNRFEKVETSARGRALGAWGFGVIPGSGIASYEEMTGAIRNQSLEQARNDLQQGAPQRPKPDRGELESRLYIVLSDYQAVSDETPDQVDDRIRQYASKTFGKALGRSAETQAWDLSSLKDGEIAVMGRAIGQTVAGLKQQKDSIAGTFPSDY